MEHEGFPAISKLGFVSFVWFVVNSLPKPYVHAFVVGKKVKNFTNRRLSCAPARERTEARFLPNN